MVHHPKEIVWFFYNVHPHANHSVCFLTINKVPFQNQPQLFTSEVILTHHLRIVFWNNYWVCPLLPNYAKSAKQHSKPVRVLANGPRTTRFSSHYYILCMGTCRFSTNWKVSCGTSCSWPSKSLPKWGLKFCMSSMYP